MSAAETLDVCVDADSMQHREKKQSKIEQSGLSAEELQRQQEELFRSSTEKYNAAPTE